MILAIPTNWRQWPTHVWVPLFLTTALLTVPMSVTAKSIFLGLAVGFIITCPAYWDDLKATLTQSWCRAALLLFFIALIACIWSPGLFREKMLVLEKYSKLLYLPILAVGFRDSRTRRAGLHAFILAMAITCLLSILKFVGIVKYHGLDPGQVFSNHIVTGYLMAFAAYLSALLFTQQSGKSRIMYGLLVLVFSYQTLFINTGRTGYVIYLLLMALLMVQILAWRKALLAVILGCSLMVVSYYQNESIHTHVGQVVKDWHLYHQDNKNTSIGYRLQVHEFANNLFKRHPWFGNGTASFTYYFREEKPVPSWNRRLLEPHSQYWLIASEFGLLGLLALGFFFVSLFMAIWRLATLQGVGIAVLLPFIIGNLTDSLLFYSSTGYFFILFMALCLGESIGGKTE